MQRRVHRERDDFIASIDEAQVCELASSFRNGDVCHHFAASVRGSFNVCYFVQFEDGERWVVRVPLEPCLAFGGKSKLESEVATMQYGVLLPSTFPQHTDNLFVSRLVTEKTTIPVPRIIAFACSDSTEPLSSFLILQYVEGEKLTFQRLNALTPEQRQGFYSSLADIMIQLRRLEFPSVGRIVRRGNSFEVCKTVASLDTNMQELEGLEPSRVQDAYYGANCKLNSANDYAAMLLDIADNAFERSRSSVVEDEEFGQDALYHLHIFREYAKAWIDPSLDQGPFVLVHGDLQPFNLLVNDKMDIVSVLDWEWSRVVPCQYFTPPLWLKNPDTTKLAYNFVYQDFLERFEHLQDIVRSREQQRYGNEKLFSEWAKAKTDSGFLVANALENWTDIDWFAFRYINWKCYKGQPDLRERVSAFIEEKPARKSFVQRKLRQGMEYEAEVALASTSKAHGVESAELTNKAEETASTTSISGEWSTFASWGQSLLAELTSKHSKILYGTAAFVALGVSYTIWIQAFQIFRRHR